MEPLTLVVPVLFFLVAVFYATVGFGGGSSYLAILALVGLPVGSIAQTALVCNLVVSAGGVVHFRRAGHLEWRKALPFVVLSIPMAYIGGRVPLGRETFLVLLGASLLVAGTRMFLPLHRPVIASMSTRTAWTVGLPIGGALGFLAGLVGIGGGIFLAPVLLLSGWADARATAAISAMFILVNSAAGLAGQLSKGFYMTETIVPLALAVFVGGQIGSRLGSRRLPVAQIRRLLAALIVLVAVRILWGAV